MYLANTASVLADYKENLPSGNLLYDIQNPFVYIPRIQFENHIDGGEGPHNGTTYRLRARPIIPYDFTEKWGLRTRTTVNMTYQGQLRHGGPQQIGLGDVDIEFYITPTRSLAKDVLMVGFGPSLHIPTSSHNMIGLNQWALGASGAIIWQPASVYSLKGWTVTLGLNQSFGIGTSLDIKPVRLFSLHPGLSYTTEHEITYSIYSESFYKWNHSQWTIPINAGISKLIQPWNQNIIVTIVGRYYVERDIYEPLWGAQLNFNFLFPAHY